MVRITLKKIVYPCWKPFMEGDSQNSGRKGDFGGIVDGLWWYEDSGKHVNGDFSMAMIQANSVLEDQCQLESGSLSSIEHGPQGTFVGVYDGHAGPEASRFINNHLFNNIKSTLFNSSYVFYSYRAFSVFIFIDSNLFSIFTTPELTSENEGMSDDVIRKAFLATEEEFISLVESEWLSNPKMASVGSCCLVGVICNGVLYVANAGDSRAVLAREEKGINGLKGVRVSEEHNASYESVREELRSLHPNDPNIVALKHNVWRVRGLIQVISLTELIQILSLFFFT